MLRLLKPKKSRQVKKESPSTAHLHKQLKLPNGEVMTYLLQRRQRKTVGLKIDERGLQVSVPKRMPMYQLEQVLLDKAAWIITKLADREANQLPAINWVDGEYLLYMGEDIQLAITQSARNRLPKLVGDTLELALTDPSPQRVQQQVAKWYQKQALSDFKKRIALYAAQLGVPTPPVKLSSARTRWGSCNSRGEIRLSWRLLQAPPAMINYVVCHELAHLKEMNHSPQFYAVLAGLMPQHRAVEKALKQLTPQLKRLDAA